MNNFLTNLSLFFVIVLFGMPLQAQDASGRIETHPYIGEAQAHTFTVTTLGANVSAVSAQRGGTIQIYMNAGQSHARQDYRLKCSLRLDDPSLPGPDGQHVIEHARRGVA